MWVSGLRGHLTLVKAREGISSNVLGAGPVGQSKVESAEQERPTRLPGTQPLRLPDVCEVLVVSPNEHGVLGPLQPVPPFHQGSVHGQKFPVPHVVIAFRRSEATGQECDWVDLLVLCRSLGQDGPDACVRRVDLHDELASGVGEDEHRGRREEAFARVQRVDLHDELASGLLGKDEHRGAVVKRPLLFFRESQIQLPFVYLLWKLNKSFFWETRRTLKME